MISLDNDVEAKEVTDWVRWERMITQGLTISLSSHYEDSKFIEQHFSSAAFLLGTHVHHRQKGRDRFKSYDRASRH